ncbi:MAG: GSCFA domain-containing protein [Winogradskyella sp.]|nr:GSCFA domain-containing protein [Winogradskyella sp.]NNK39381.1 GSCFA domain-containing protein [Winogradskyella sp.]
MKLHTSVNLEPQAHGLIDYNSQLLMLGSCFAENMGYFLNYFKFKTQLNPFGILFNPIAIENLITRAINKEYYKAEDVYHSNEQWFCFEAHSKLNSVSKNELVDDLNNALDLTYQHVLSATHICITLGTAWVYRLIEQDKIVANCHKQPQKLFLKELLSVDAIEHSLNGINALIKDVNPKVSVIYTVSPVRHVKDGLVENNQSKAHLISALHAVVDQKQHIHYFPAYELMMDELRDYRFYEDDLIHPNCIATSYIWEKFQEVWLSEDVSEYMKQIDQIQKGLQHRPFNENSESHQKFLKDLENKIAQVSKQLTHISF